MTVRDEIENPDLLNAARKAFWLLTIFYIAAMFLPRAVPTGMFGDGLLYASLARNLAEGTGMWWKPFFAHGYWVTGVIPTTYYENPPLFFWLQSCFFFLFGDHFWIEKLWSFLLLACNCFLISRLWEVLLKGRSRASNSLNWLPVWLFYFIPVVVWGTPNNLIDPLLLTFCLLAIWCILHALVNQTRIGLFFSLACMFMFLGLLTKGPTALYPVVVPAFYAFFFQKDRLWPGMFQSVLLFGGTIACFILLLLLSDGALEYFTQYWHQRLEVAIVGGRDDGLRMGWHRLYIFYLIGRECSMLIGITIILLLIGWFEKINFNAFKYENRIGLFYFCVGLAATVPVMASTRQAGMYLIPGLALMAMAFGYGCIPVIWTWMNRMSLKSSRIISTVTCIAIVVVIFYSAAKFGKPGREHALLHDLPAIQSLIPKGETVAVCDLMMTNFVYHVYLQRFHHLSLTTDSHRPQYLLLDQTCLGMVPASYPGFNEIYTGELMHLFQRDTDSD